METATDWRAESAARKAVIVQTLDSLGLSITAQFVPFSQSRNKGEKHKTLNWRVTVQRNGRDVMTTDYSAGIAHCPGHDTARKVPSNFVPHGYKTHNGKPYPGTSSAHRPAKPHEALQQFIDALCAAETESGFKMQWSPLGRGEFVKARERSESDGQVKQAYIPILPDSVDVFYSLSSETDVLDHSGFDDWAENFGYDTDSRNAESIYRACLDTALKFRAAIGESGIAQLQSAYEDY